MILLGGTMQPFDYIQQQLGMHCSSAATNPQTAPREGANDHKTRAHAAVGFRTFACGHVIPATSILPLTVAKGPTGVEMDFTFKSRGTHEQVSTAKHLASSFGPTRSYFFMLIQGDKDSHSQSPTVTPIQALPLVYTSCHLVGLCPTDGRIGAAALQRLRRGAQGRGLFLAILRLRKGARRALDHHRRALPPPEQKGAPIWGLRFFLERVFRCMGLRAFFFC